MYARPLTEVHTMPAVRVHVPKYCLHKARGLAYVRDRGKVRYLGKHGSPESQEAYARFLIEWEAHRAGASLPLPDWQTRVAHQADCRPDEPSGLSDCRRRQDTLGGRRSHEHPRPSHP
jgi:hypothetical protein